MSRRAIFRSAREVEWWSKRRGQADSIRTLPNIRAKIFVNAKPISDEWREGEEDKEKRWRVTQ